MLGVRNHSLNICFLLSEHQAMLSGLWILFHLVMPVTSYVKYCRFALQMDKLRHRGSSSLILVKGQETRLHVRSDFKLLLLWMGWDQPAGCPTCKFTKTTSSERKVYVFIFPDGQYSIAQHTLRHGSLFLLDNSKSFDFICLYLYHEVKDKAGLTCFILGRETPMRMAALVFC